MINIREERATDVVARENLLDEAYGAVRFAKASERLREGRLPAKGLSLVALSPVTPSLAASAPKVNAKPLVSLPQRLPARGFRFRNLF